MAWKPNKPAAILLQQQADGRWYYWRNRNDRRPVLIPFSRMKRVGDLVGATTYIENAEAERAAYYKDEAERHQRDAASAAAKVLPRER